MEKKEKNKEDKEENKEEKESTKGKREIVVPGEVIASGPHYLPGDYTSREGNDIIASRFGLVDITDRLVKIIPLAGVYMARKGNIVIGRVIDITFNGWIIDINAPYLAFLPISEAGRYVNKADITQFLDFHDVIAAEVYGVKHRGIDLTMRKRGLGKLEGGIITVINPSKVPRVIGREGSMVNLIKKETNTNIIVGQNGVIWVKGDNIESELLAKEAITFIVERSFVEGLTDEVKKFLEREGKSEGK